MNPKYKKSFRSLIYHAWAPVITRIEKYRAVRLWRAGVKECQHQAKKQGNHPPRFYLIYAPRIHRFVPMVYEPRQNCIAMRRLLQMGKIARHISVADMKRMCYYYTPSHHTEGCEADNSVKAEKLKLWLVYYLRHVSTPMQKLRAFRP